VPPGSHAAWSNALIGLLDNDELRTAVCRRAHDHRRAMVWSNVATQYRRLFARVVAGARVQARPTGSQFLGTSAIVDGR
ncbi:MAG: hypothetical protein ABIG85_00795, partial [Chloroflexota bacterium]